MKTVFLKFSVVVILLSLTTVTFADLIEQRPTASTDRLEELTRAVLGSYEAPKLAANIRNNQEMEDKENLVASEDEDVKFIPVSNDFLKANRIKKIYPDSIVYFAKEEQDYWERKRFSHNILMIRNINFNQAYFIYDGEELDDSWVVKCSKDHITDEKKCLLNKFNFAILKSSKHGLNVSASYEVNLLNYRANHYIRIDQNKAWKTNYTFDGSSALNIINQMQKGQYAYTRFVEWSNQYEETLPLVGFTAAYQTMLKMYAAL